MSTTIIINPFFFSSVSYDADAQNYIDRVEAADGAALETAVKDAMNQLVLDLKSNSLWTPLVYALPGSGPRTINGGLIPLQNTTASSTSGTVTWGRETGFNCGAALTNISYPGSILDTNTGSQNNFSISAWISQIDSANGQYFGSTQTFMRQVATIAAVFRCRSNTSDILANNTDIVGFRGMSRSASSNYSRRINGVSTGVSRNSNNITGATYRIFGSPGGGFQSAIGTEIGWNHVGTSLTLATLETVVTTYRTSINAAI